MSKKDFIALADAIKEHNAYHKSRPDCQFGLYHMDSLANFCQSQNSNFKRDRWLAYIAGECGPNGGKL